jgi:2'-5' RNA ligase
MRLFISLALPATARSRVEELLNRLRRWKAPVGWVRADGLHLTLKFLGEVEEDHAPEIGRILKETAEDRTAFTVRLAEIGCFPSFRLPRVVWLGARPSDGRLADFQRAIEQAMVPAGFQSERRPFHPHLTLGRVRSTHGLEELRREIEQYRWLDLGEATLTDLHLIRSEMGRGGSVYTPLVEIRLG